MGMRKCNNTTRIQKVNLNNTNSISNNVNYMNYTVKNSFKNKFLYSKNSYNLVVLEIISDICILKI